jgi:hypothetical protein
MHGTTSKEFTKWLIYIIKLSILLIIHKECVSTKCIYKIYLIQQNLALIYQSCPRVCDDPANDNNKIINNLIMKFTSAH